jgi:hypothetical protein
MFIDIDVTIVPLTKVDKENFIKIDKLFNIIKLSDDIPFVALSKRYSDGKTREPLIKTHNSLLEQVSSKEVKSWVLNEKKYLNQATFKIIKGIMLKIKIPNFVTNFLTVNILPNGTILVNVKLPQISSNTLSLNEIITIIKTQVSELVSNINSYDVFLKSKHLSNINDSILIIDSIYNIITTKFHIDRSKFAEVVKNKMISNKLLELKPTESLDILSLLYKKTRKAETSDIKGLTINIKDNPYDLDSSIISIFGAENLVQIQLITTLIYLLSELSKLKEDEEGDIIIKKKPRKVKEKTNKAKLKEHGFFADSKKCQKPRQPSIVEDDILNENTIKFDKWTFRCDNKKYPYPGFHPDNIPCCFKNNQVGNEAYIRNMDPSSLNLLVRPSNFKVKIKNGKKPFETFVMKLLDDEDSDKFYYISESNKLDLITDPKTIDIIKTKEKNPNDVEIWLDAVTLSQLVYPPSTNKCSTQPQLNKRLSDVGINTLIDYTNINGPCSHHKKSSIFGYGGNSIPCCYDTERPIYPTRFQKEFDITKQYILTTSNKLLNYQKIGVLPIDIISLFKLVNKTENDIYYRMGIVQSNHSLLSAVLLGINNQLREDIHINGITDFRKVIIDYLTDFPGEFKRFNHGQISMKFNSVENYKNYIKNHNNVLHWQDTIDLLEAVTDHNILILDINNKTRILCRPGKVYDTSKPFIILLKKKYNDEINIKLNRIDTYELVIKLEYINSEEEVRRQGNKLTKAYAFDEKIVKFLVDYYNDSCIKENVYPENYTYVPLKDFKTLESLVSIKYQITNDFNRVNLVITSDNVILPILETGIVDNKETISFKKIINNPNKLPSLEKYIDAFKNLNKKGLNIKINGITISNNPKIGGLLLNNGGIVPFQLTKSIETYKEPKLDFIYYLDIDEKLKGPNDNVSLPYNHYIQLIQKTNNDIFTVKTEIVKRLQAAVNTNDIKNYLEKMIKSPGVTRSDKINNIVKIFIQLMKKKDLGKESTLYFIFQTIANEMLLDNIENSLLNGIIINQNENTDDIIKRDSESILLNRDDIYKWIQKYELA